MLSFQDIPGNAAVKDSLRAALRTRFPQAVLLTGPTGSGKMRLALALAAGLLCTGPGERPCGACPSCRKMDHGVHPDLDIVDEGDAALPVALARTLRSQVMVLPNDGDRRVVIVRHAQHLNPQAQNALLKVLEEPPRYAFFILTSEQPGEILETIRSRCTRYQLAPPAADSAQQSDFLPLIMPFVQALAEGNEYQMLLAAMALEKLSKPDFQAALGLLQTALRDAILTGCGLSGALRPALAEWTRRLAGRTGRNQLLALYDFVGVLSRRTEINAAPAIQCAGLCAQAYQLCIKQQALHVGG